MKDLLKIISAKSLNIIAKENNEQDEAKELEEEEVERTKKWEEEKEREAEDEEQDAIQEKSTKEDLIELEKHPEHIISDEELSEEAEEKIDEEKREKEDKGISEVKDEDDHISVSLQEKKDRAVLDRGLDFNSQDPSDFTQTYKLCDKERDAIRRLKKLRERILKRLKISEETNEGDTDE